MPHITQIAARVVSGTDFYNQYVMTKQQISPGAKETIGIAMAGGKMYRYGKEVPKSIFKDDFR